MIVSMVMFAILGFNSQAFYPSYSWVFIGCVLFLLLMVMGGFILFSAKYTQEEVAFYRVKDGHIEKSTSIHPSGDLFWERVPTMGTVTKTREVGKVIELQNNI